MKGLLEGPVASSRVGRAGLLLIAAIFLAPALIYSMVGWDDGDPAHPLLVVTAAAAIGGLHLRHAFAAVVGERPRAWPLTLGVMVVATYAPIADWGWNWASVQWFAVASVLMLIRPVNLASAIAALPVVATVAVVIDVVPDYPEATFSDTALLALYWLAGSAVGSAALYGSVRLVRVLDELATARADLADAAVSGERQRVSRDLHDLLGQSLSAVSLKGDLALALLDRDEAAARREIESITEVARDALRGVRSVAHDDHSIALGSEVDGGLALLSAAGVKAETEVEEVELSREVDRLLGWAVREGVTNVVRHSDASICEIAISEDQSRIALRVHNDGVVDRGGGDGTGLVGLRERARALGGDLEVDRRGRLFTLTVWVSTARPLELVAARGGQR